MNSGATTSNPAIAMQILAGYRNLTPSFGFQNNDPA
jgi:hypothetical protein